MKLDTTITLTTNTYNEYSELEPSSTSTFKGKVVDMIRITEQNDTPFPHYTAVILVPYRILGNIDLEDEKYTFTINGRNFRMTSLDQVGFTGTRPKYYQIGLSEVKHEVSD